MTVALLNKPFRVLCQFTDEDGRQTLRNYIELPGVYAAGRLDYDSEGLVILTDNGHLQHQITDPGHRLGKTYLVQVEGEADQRAVARLRSGVLLKDGLTRPAEVETIEPPSLWDRDPPVRSRRLIPTSWLRMTIREGRNRQVRRMTAAVGMPTLRLVRIRVGEWELGDLRPGQWRLANERWR
ncbi:MAG: pseudouridine synthase [Acidobacteria bacterium]|nr:pseudouridine synthase [Acidobacteriota bacterium]